MPEYSNYLEGLTAVVGALDGTEIIGASKDGDAVSLTSQQIADLGGGGTSIPFGSTSGTNTYTIAATPAVTAYTDGMLLHVRVAASSTGLVTLNFDSIGAKKLLDTDGSQATDGYLKAGVDYIVTYNSALDSAVGAFTVVNEIQHGVMNLRGVFAASGGLYPGAGGSGPAGAIRHGDTWVVSGTDTIGSITLRPGDLLTTAVDAPGQTASNWYVFPGYTSVVGVQDFFIPASAFWPRTTGGCQLLTQTEIATSLNNIQTLDFDQTTQEFAQVHYKFPKKYNLSTFTFEVEWTATTGTGSVVWAVSAVALADGDALSTAYGTPVTVTDAAGTANTLRNSPTSAAVTIANTPAVLDGIYLQISRNPADGSDDMAADAKFKGLAIHITNNAATDN